VLIGRVAAYTEQLGRLLDGDRRSHRVAAISFRSSAYSLA
jgi:hypothetical protein